MEPEKPQKLGRYEIVRELGKGAMGIVYEGLDPVIDRRVAIKTARLDIMQISGRAQEMMERFLREAHAAGALNHPGIVTIYDAAEENGIAYIAMEYFDSGSLLDHVKKRGPFSPEQIVAIGVTTCRALHVAHEAGVIHRDIKPANIMVRQDGSIKVADFGIAHVSDSNLTQEGALIGTPAYMSPEQFMGHKIDGRADLFAVAVMLYEMLTGEKPFPGETFNAVMHKVVKTDPVAPSELNPAVNEALNQVILKALRKNPKLRYQTGNEFANALTESLKDVPDPKVLGLEPDTTEKTVITPIETEIVLENAPPRTNNRTSDSPALKDAPATVIGEPPPNAQTTATFVQSPVKTGRSYTRAGSVVVALVVLIGIGMIFMKPPESKAPPTVSSNANAFTKVVVTVWFAPTKEAYDAATMNADYTLCIGKGTATVHVTTPKNTEPPVAIEEKITETANILLPTPCNRILVNVEADSYTSSGPREKTATKPDETAQYDIVLKKQDGAGG